MSALKAFLQPSKAGTTKKVIISERFKDDEGNPVPFTLKAISQEENEKLAQMSRKSADDAGTDKLDASLYTKRLVLACVQEPDFKDQEMCKYYGVVDPMEVPAKMLSIGEYKRLSDAIMDLNDMGADVRKKIDSAKNS